MKRVSCYVKPISVTILLIVAIMPAIYLIAGTVSALLHSEISSTGSISVSLFFKSILLNLAIAFFSVLLGLISALGIWTFWGKWASRIAILITLLILIPPYIHVQSWIFFTDRFIAGFTGNLAVIVTAAFSYLPVTAGLCLVALLGISGDHADLCMSDETCLKAFTKLYLPYIYPAAFTGFILVFLVNINDYAIPSVFGVNVYALELFSRFSAGGSIFSVFLDSIPLVLCSLFVLILSGYYLSKKDLSFYSVYTDRAANPFKNSIFIRIPSYFGMVILIFFMMVPIFNLFFEAVKAENKLDIISGSFKELFYSVYISGATALGALIPSFVFAAAFARTKIRIWIIAISSLPFILPSSIIGLAMISLWNNPYTEDIYMSPFMPSLAMICRFTFIEAVFLTVAMSRLDIALIENMRLFYPGIIKYTVCLIKMTWRECSASVLTVFALAMGDFGVTLLVTPPGYQTLTVKIFNYLHYGASETVSILCLTVLLIIIISLSAICLIFKGDRYV